jgi:hypothetical protein
MLLDNKVIITKLMNALKTALIIATLILISCEKSEPDAGMNGVWHIYGSGGGFSGRGATYDFDYMLLERDKEYEFVRNGTIIESGAYLLSPYSGDFSPGEFKIRFNPGHVIDDGVRQISENEMIVDLMTADTLSLCDGWCDGYCYYFAKE